MGRTGDGLGIFNRAAGRQNMFATHDTAEHQSSGVERFGWNLDDPLGDRWDFGSRARNLALLLLLFWESPASFMGYAPLFILTNTLPGCAYCVSLGFWTGFSRSFCFLKSICSPFSFLSLRRFSRRNKSRSRGRWHDEF